MSLFGKIKERKAEKELNDYILDYQKIYVDELIEMHKMKSSNMTAILALFLILDESKRIYEAGDHTSKKEKLDATRNIMMGAECNYTIWCALFYELNRKILAYGFDPMLIEEDGLTDDESHIIGLLSDVVQNVFQHPNGVSSINNTFDEIYDYAQSIMDEIELDKESTIFKESKDYAVMLNNLKAKLSTGKAIMMN